MFLLQLPLFDSHSVWLGCCIFWTHLVLCCLSVSAFTFVLPRNKGWCGCGLSRSRVVEQEQEQIELLPVGRRARRMRPQTEWGGGQDMYPLAGPGGHQGQTQPWRAGQGCGDGARQRPGWGICPQVRVAWHRHGWAQLRSAPRPSIQPSSQAAGRPGGSPTSHSPFPTQLISLRPGSAAAPGAGPVPAEHTRGSPGLGWGSQPEAEAASRSLCSPAGCREAGKLEKQMCKFQICGNFTEINTF